MRRGGLVWGLILLLVGALLLLNNLGLLSVDLGSAIWAVLLIALGLGLLWSVVVGSGGAHGQDVSIPLGDAIGGRLELNHVMGRLRVDGSASAGHFLEGIFSGGVDYRTQYDQDEVAVRVSPRSVPFFLAPWNWGGRGKGWELGLNPEIPLVAQIETAASDVRLDLSDLNVTDLSLETGASSAHIVAPAHAGHSRIRIQAGAASVTVEVPPDVAARIGFQGALASVDIDTARFPRTSGVYQSADYDVAPNRVEVEVEAGVGSIQVR